MLLPWISSIQDQVQWSLIDHELVEAKNSAFFAPAAPIAQESLLSTQSKGAREGEREEGKERGREEEKGEEFVTRCAMTLPAANNHEFAAGLVAIRIHSHINSGHRSAVKYLRECGRWCWGILCWAATKPWEANTEQVRDTLSQEPRGKDLLNQGTRWSALLKGDSQRQILFFSSL